MSKLVVVGFGEDGVSGDSFFDTTISCDYVEGMSIEDVDKAFKTAYIESVRNDKYANMNDWTDDEIFSDFCLDSENVVVGHVIKESTLAIINNYNIDAGNDSSSYACNELLKSQVQLNAITQIK